MLALAHLPAGFLRLLVGHPERTGEAACYRLAPEHQHIDALVGLPIGAQRPGDAALGMLSIPRFEPWAHAVFKLGNDAVGDTAIKIGAGAGHGSALPVD